MKESSRTRRMERHHKRNKAVAALNMVSMMDIFTILLFFLLVSATETDNLPSMRDIKLPKAHTDLKPKENLVILVNKNEILFQNKSIVAASKVTNSSQLIIPELYSALDQHVREKTSRRISAEEIKKSGVTIMGDKEVPYDMLKKIMMTCASGEFTNISLAVEQKAAEAQ